jgi:hypothetical protein
MRASSILALAFACTAVPAAAQNAASAAPATPAVELNNTQWTLLGRQVTEWFFVGQTDSILAHSSPDVLDRMGGAKGLLEARDELASRVGSEVEVITDKMTKRKGNPQYWRESKYENAPEPIVLRFVFNAQAQIIGIGMGPLSQTPAPDPS